MIDLIEKRLEELISSKDEPLFQAARYSLLSKGKRIRPLLTLKTAKLFGLDPLQLLDPACAIEMIHAYSLIHDDLPCMDNADMRRNRPSLHKAYGEAMALLAGDYLLTRAFEVIADSSAPHKEKIIKVVAKRASAPGMIGGQALDIASQGKEIDETTLLEMQVGKTSSLLTACLEVGALSSEFFPLLQKIGYELGLVYQFQDDLFDATSLASLIGKTVGLDEKNQKATAVSYYGVGALQTKLEKMKTSIFNNLQKLPNQGAGLIEFVEMILKREK